MTPQEFHKSLDNVSLTRHVLRCTITFGIVMIIFKKLFNINVTTQDINMMLFWMIGWDFMLSYLRPVKAYYLRSALSYCIIGLLFQIFQVIQPLHLLN